MALQLQALQQQQAQQQQAQLSLQAQRLQAQFQIQMKQQQMSMQRQMAQFTQQLQQEQQRAQANEMVRNCPHVVQRLMELEKRHSHMCQTPLYDPRLPLLTCQAPCSAQVQHGYPISTRRPFRQLLAPGVLCLDLCTL